MLGWSWLVPPYTYFFDARAVTPVSATALDGACLRGKCEADPELGYQLLKRVTAEMYKRLQSARDPAARSVRLRTFTRTDSGMRIANSPPASRLIGIEGLDELYRALAAEGYRVIGPAVQDGAIVLRELSSAAELPSAGASGWSRAGTSCAAAMTPRPSGTRRARRAGSGSCTRRGSGCGRPRARRKASSFRGR